MHYTTYLIKEALYKVAKGGIGDQPPPPLPTPANPKPLNMQDIGNIPTNKPGVPGPRTFLNPSAVAGIHNQPYGQMQLKPMAPHVTSPIEQKAQAMHLEG